MSTVKSTCPAGIAAPLGPLLGGFLFDHAGRARTFLTLSAMVAALTITMHLSTAIRTMHRPGEQTRKAINAVGTLT
jgi:hypothetical protein